MSRKQTIIRGTIILTITGFLSRFMGFFYRIFLQKEGNHGESGHQSRHRGGARDEQR
ncbi:MAG: hypothetical protein HFH16_11205 [Ruminococcus sp.]|nr:hypothetical protein [Ruminococcus sp.]